MWGRMGLTECPLWVKSRPLQRTSRCPLSANSGHGASLEHLVRSSRGSVADILLAAAPKRESDDKTEKNERDHRVDNEVSTHLVRLIYHRPPTIGMRRPSASSAIRFLTHDVIKKTSLCWALYRTYARPIEIVIRPKFIF